MKQQCLDRFKNIESLREEIETRYDLYTIRQHLYQPASGGWNLLQVLDHILMSEKLSVIYMKRMLSAKKVPPKTGLKSVFRSTALKLALYLPMKFKSPSMVDSTDKKLQWPVVKQNWQTIRRELKKIVQETDEDLLMRSIYKHPVAGTMNMKQALDFMENHLLHHKKQMEKIAENEHFPGPE